MSPEEKVFTYSILSSFSFIILVFASFFSEIAINYYRTGSNQKRIPEQTIINYTNQIFSSVAVISSVVFYSLAMSEIKKIKKTNYYKASIFFLLITSIIYAFIISLLVIVLKDKITN